MCAKCLRRMSCYDQITDCRKTVYNGNADRTIPITRAGIPHILPERNSSAMYLSK